MDVVILAGVIIFLCGMYNYGRRKGFIRIALSLILSVVALMLSVMLEEPLKNFIITNTDIDEKVNSKMEEYVEKYIASEMNIASDELQKDSINELKLPAVIREKLIENNTDDMKLNMEAETFSEYIARSLTDILIESMVLVILFIGIKIFLRFIVSVADIISRLPIIRNVNKTLGGVTGLAEGMIIIWAALILVTAFGATEIGEQILGEISSNKILSFIYNNNLLLRFFI